MLCLSVTDVAIRSAAARGTLVIERGFSVRLGVEFWAISDEHGLIEVALTEAEARKRCGL